MDYADHIKKFKAQQELKDEQSRIAVDAAQAKRLEEAKRYQQFIEEIIEPVLARAATELCSAGLPARVIAEPESLGGTDHAFKRVIKFGTTDAPLNYIMFVAEPSQGRFLYSINVGSFRDSHAFHIAQLNESEVEGCCAEFVSKAFPLS